MGGVAKKHGIFSLALLSVPEAKALRLPISDSIKVIPNLANRSFYV